MIRTLLPLLLLAAAVIWLLRRSRGGVSAQPTADGFRVTLVAGRVRRASGTIPRATFNAFEDVASQHGLDGEITWDPDGGLRFSASIPEGVQQQFRNVHAASRSA